MKSALDSALDALYATAPEQFIDTRKSLAAKLKADGHTEAAKEVLAQHKPTRGAYVLNQLARRFPDEIGQLAKVGERLAQASAKPNGDALREAIIAQRDAVKALTEKAIPLFKELRATAAEQQMVSSVVSAATRSEENASALQQGRFSKAPEESSSFFDGSLAPLTLSPSAEKPQPSPPRASEKNEEKATSPSRAKDDEAAAAKRKALEREANDAKDAAEHAEAKAKTARERVEQLKAEARSLRDEARVLEKAAHDAAVAAERASKKADAAAEKVEGAETHAQALADDAVKAHDAYTKLHKALS